MAQGISKNAIAKSMIIALGCAGLVGPQAAVANAASSADVAAPLKQSGAVDASPLGHGDAEFRRIFNSWDDLGRNRGGETAPRAKVSVPSLIPLVDSRLTSGYGMRRHPVLGVRRGHKGIDLAAPTGTPIYAPANGTVSRANRFSSYGLYVSLEHGGAIQTRFAHMSRIAVAAGERVKKGDLIGYVGSTGRSTGPHLHYEVRVEGKAVNPLPYMVERHNPTSLALRQGAGGRGGPE